MNDLIPVKVGCHSGFKADEYPKYFYLDEMRFEIKEIKDRWYQGEQNPEFPHTDYFKVSTIDNKYFILKHDIKSDKWYLMVHNESINL